MMMLVPLVPLVPLLLSMLMLMTIAATSRRCGHIRERCRASGLNNMRPPRPIITWESSSTVKSKCLLHSIRLQLAGLCGKEPHSCIQLAQTPIRRINLAHYRQSTMTAPGAIPMLIPIVAESPRVFFCVLPEYATSIIYIDKQKKVPTPAPLKTGPVAMLSPKGPK